MPQSSDSRTRRASGNEVGFGRPLRCSGDSPGGIRDEHLPACSCSRCDPHVRLLHPPCYCRRRSRSEEHTSELQSPCNLVCRLLLEKKKKKPKYEKILKDCNRKSDQNHRFGNVTHDQKFN